MNNIITLRGLVLSKYKTIGQFADDIGWKRNRASRILNGKQQLDAQDIHDITKCLDIDSIEVFMFIFFSNLSTKWTDKTQNLLAERKEKE